LPAATENRAGENKDAADCSEPLQRLHRATAELDQAIAALTEKTRIDNSE